MENMENLEIGNSSDEYEAFLEGLNRVLDYLQMEFEGYPYCDLKDSKYYRRLFTEFRGLDIEEELKQFHAWTLDQPEYKKLYYRSRFRSWLKSAIRFQNGSKSLF